MALAIIGSAGRKGDAPRMNPGLYDAMYAETLRAMADWGTRELASGGAAFAVDPPYGSWGYDDEATEEDLLEIIPDGGDAAMAAALADAEALIARRLAPALAEAGFTQGAAIAP